MICVKDISYSYGVKQKTTVLEQISFCAEYGDFIGILGTNGAGKSTLLSCINKTIKPSSGTVFIGSQDIHKLKQKEIAKHIAIVSQRNELSQTTVFESILLGRLPYMGFSASDMDISFCNAIIKELDLSTLKSRNIDELSGGEVQKVMLARALVQEPKLLLLDEPTNNLDPKNQYEMLDFIKKFAKNKKITVFMVIHDINLALRYCDNVLFLKNSNVFAYGDTSIVNATLLEEVFGIKSKIVQFENQKLAVIQ